MKLRRITYYILFSFLFFCSFAAVAQKPFLSDDANEQLKNLPIEQQDAYLLVQGKHYYAFYTRESYRRAMECYLEALRLALSHNHQDVVNKCYFGIGSVYDANNNLPQAIRYYKMNYDGILKIRPFNPLAVLRASYNIAATYGKARDTQNAYHYSLKMGQMISWIADSAQRTQYKLLVAQSFAVIGKDRDFVEYFNQLPADAHFEDAELAFGRLYAEAKSKYALILGKKEQVLPPLLEELNHTKDSIPLLNLVVKAYAVFGNYAKAYEYQQILVSADLRSMDKNTYGDINYRLLEADNLLKQRLNDELRMKQSGSRIKLYLLYALCLILSIALAAMVYFYRKLSRSVKKAALAEEAAFSESNVNEAGEPSLL